MDENNHILVVDDNQENLRVVSGFLKDKGYKIALALDGNSALAILENHKMDLILLDIMMPEMDGFETCKKIKAIPKNKNIPIIFLTAKTETDDIVNGFKMGGSDYITKPFKKEELFARINNQLELANSKKKIIEMNRNRDKLYSIISHDIRTPFSGIIQTIDAITNGYIDVKSEDFKEIIKHLHISTINTSKLLDNLLEWTKIQTNIISLSPKTITVYSLLSECVQLFKSLCIQKNILIKLDINVTITAFCDNMSTKTIFRNILSNAIKYTPQNGTIIIYCNENVDKLDICFEDSGIGMSEEVVKKVFFSDDLYSTSGTNNEKGSGFGLVVAKDFINKNNGNLNIESSIGKGTTITVSLPLNK